MHIVNIKKKNSSAWRSARRHIERVSVRLHRHGAAEGRDTNSVCGVLVTKIHRSTAAGDTHTKNTCRQSSDGSHVDAEVGQVLRAGRHDAHAQVLVLQRGQVFLDHAAPALLLPPRERLGFAVNRAATAPSSSAAGGFRAVVGAAGYVLVGVGAAVGEAPRAEAAAAPVAGEREAAVEVKERRAAPWARQGQQAVHHVAPHLVDLQVLLRHGRDARPLGLQPLLVPAGQRGKCGHGASGHGINY